MSELRPMSDEAKSGELVLLFQNGHYDLGRWIVEGHQRHEQTGSSGKKEIWEWVDVDTSHWDNENFEVYDPTHWMPLPSPPPTSAEPQ